MEGQRLLYVRPREWNTGQLCEERSAQFWVIE